MKRVSPQRKLGPLGPHSRVLSRGALGDAIDGRSKEGRFLRVAEQELLLQLSREPSFAERLLVRRISRSMLQTELYDQKLSGGGAFTAHDARAFSALGNQIRLGLRDLGLKPAALKTKTASPLAAHFANPPVREVRG